MTVIFCYIFFCFFFHPEWGLSAQIPIHVGLYTIGNNAVSIAFFSVVICLRCGTAISGVSPTQQRPCNSHWLRPKLHYFD